MNPIMVKKELSGYLSKGKLATNAQLVEKAIRIVENLGVSTMTPEETREKLKLVKHK